MVPVSPPTQILVWEAAFSYSRPWHNALVIARTRAITVQIKKKEASVSDEKRSLR